MRDAKLSGEEFDLVAERGSSVIDRLASRIAHDMRPAKPSPVATTALPEIPGYEFRGLLGRGGMGHVYLAWQTRMQRLVAIKILPAASALQPELVGRFERELAAVGRLSHPSIVTGFDAGDINGYHYLVMEYVPGKTLDRLIQQHGTMPVGVACEIIRQAAIGLAKVHEAELIHRDIKPSNLMLADDGMTRILDLGLARLGEAFDDLSVSGQVVGTIDYMAPEQAAADSNVDFRADIYGLGATLYKLLCGISPVDSLKHLPPVKKLVQIASGKLPSRHQDSQNLPQGLVNILDRMLEADPSDRHSSALQVADALAEYCDSSALNEIAKQISPEQCQSVSGATAEVETSTDARARKATAFSFAEPEPTVKPQNHLGSQTTVAFTPETTPSPRRWPPLRFLAVGLALLGGLTYLLATVFFVQVEDGVIRFEINDPKIKIEIGEDSFTIDDHGKKINLEPGAKTLRITREDFTFETVNFVLRQGDNPALVVDFIDNEIRLAQGDKILDRQVVTSPNAEPDPVSDSDALTASTSWQRGEDSDGLPGLIPTPSRRKGLGRWQVTARSAPHAVFQPVWSPDGRWVACFADIFGATRCGSKTGELRLYDAKTHRLARVIALGRAYQVSWSPDSRWIAMGEVVGSRRWIRLFTSDGTAEHRVEILDGMLEKHQWSSDSKHLVVAGAMNSDVSTCALIEVISGKYHELRGEQDLFAGHAWHPSGKLLATAWQKASIRLCNSDGTTVPFDVDDLGHVHAIDWHPEGEWLALASDVAGVQLRRRDGTQGATFDHGDEAVVFLRWSPDGKFLATISDAEKLRIWNRDGTIKRQCPGQYTVSFIWHPDPVYWHPQSLGIVACQGQVFKSPESVYWSVESGPAEPLCRAGIASWNANGTRLIISASQEWKGQQRLFRFQQGDINLIDWEIDQLNKPFNTLFGGTASAWSPDGAQCVLATEFMEDADVIAGDNLCFFDADGKHLDSPVRSVCAHELAIHPKHDLIAVGDDKGHVRVLNSDGHGLAAWTIEQAHANVATESESYLDPKVTHLDWHQHDSALIACNSKHVYVSDGRDGRQLAHITANQIFDALSASFVPANASQIAIGVGDQIGLWDWKHDQQQWKSMGRRIGGRICWSSDGKQMMTRDTGGREAYLWDSELNLKSTITTVNHPRASSTWWPQANQFLLTQPQPGKVNTLQTRKASGSEPAVSLIDAVNAAISSDGKWIAATHIGKNQTGVVRPMPQLLHSDGSQGPELESSDDLFKAHTNFTPIAFTSDNQFVVAATVNRIAIWHVSTGKLHRIILLLPDNQMATFSPAGELLYATPDADKELIYLVEQENGRLDMLAPQQFD